MAIARRPVVTVRPTARPMLGLLMAAALGLLSLGWAFGSPAATQDSGTRSKLALTGFAGMRSFVGTRLAHPVVLPPATAPPTFPPPSVAEAAPLRPHEVFGFAPYWTLGQSGGFDVAGFTTIAYFALGVNPDGSLAESGAGWNGYESQALVNLIDRAHAAGTRVVLSVNDFDQGSLDQLTSNPAAAATLATTLTAVIQAKDLDGVNLDLEGDGPGDRAGLTRLVAEVSGVLHRVNPHWQVTLDTYASSAGDSGGFFDVSALAAAVDGFFVMAYAPNLAAAGQPASPLTSSLFSDLTAAQQYSGAVPGDKVILGAPLFGYDWPTNGGSLTSTAIGPATPVAEGQIEASGHPAYWDPVTDSAWTAYEVGSQWHEAFYDDASSLYQVANLAQANGLAGVGAWALGMEADDPATVAALDGNAPVVQYAAPGPSAPLAAPGLSSGGGSATSPTGPTNPTSAASGAAPTTVPSTAPAPAGASGGTKGGSAGESGGTGGTGGSGGSGPLPTPPVYVFGGEYQGTRVSLTLVTGPLPGSQPTPPPSGAAPPVTSSPVTGSPTPWAPLPASARMVGVLTGFSTNDPALTCVAGEDQSGALKSSLSSDSSPGANTSTTIPTLPKPTVPELVVWSLGSLDPSRDYIATKAGPSCGSAVFAFRVPADPSIRPTLPTASRPLPVSSQ